MGRTYYFFAVNVIDRGRQRGSGLDAGRRVDARDADGECQRTGFRGALDWDRALDRHGELSAPWAGAHVTGISLDPTASGPPPRVLASSAWARMPLIISVSGE